MASDEGQRARTRSVFSPEALLSHTVLVTGGTRGIGRFIAEHLGRHGARVVLTGRSPDDALSVAEELMAAGIDATGYALEVSSTESIEDLANRIDREIGGADVVVNNAGTNIPQRALDVSEEAWDTVQAANLKGTFFVSQALARRWVAGDTNGTIVNVASQAGLVAIDLRAAYCSSKAGVINLTRELALEWAEYGIRVNAVAPTFVLTPMTEPMFSEEGFRNKVLSMIPMGRVAQPHEVADAVLYLASEASAFVTGHTLVVDGGWTIH